MSTDLGELVNFICQMNLKGFILFFSYLGKDGIDVLGSLFRTLFRVGCLATMLGAFIAHADEPFPPDIKKIKDRGKLIVAQFSGTQPGFFDFQNEAAPGDELFFAYEGKRIVGIDIVLATRIAEALGVKLELDRSSQDFNSVCMKVARGETDIGVSKLSITLERAQYVRFTEPYVVLGVGIAVNRLLASKAGADIPTWELCNRPTTRIGVLKASAFETYAREFFPHADIKGYDNLDDLFKAAADKEVFAVLGENFNLRLKFQKEPKWALWLRFVPLTGKRDPIAIAVAPDSPNLLAFLDLFLEHDNMKTNLDEMLQKAESSRVPSVESVRGGR